MSIPKCPVCNKSFVNDRWVWFWSSKYQATTIKLCPACKKAAFPLCPNCEKPVDRCFTCGNI